MLKCAQCRYIITVVVICYYSSSNILRHPTSITIINIIESNIGHQPSPSNTQHQPSPGHMARLPPSHNVAGLGKDATATIPGGAQSLAVAATFDAVHRGRAVTPWASRAALTPRGELSSAGDGFRRPTEGTPMLLEGLGQLFGEEVIRINKFP